MTNNDLFPDLLPPHVEFTDEDWAMYCAAEDRKLEIKRLRAEITAMTGNLQRKLDEHDFKLGLFPNGTAYIIKDEDIDFFDKKAFEHENPELAAKYTKTKPSTKIDVIEKGMLPRTEVANDNND